ncbi:MAG TPA: glycosyltransferase family 2 protein, partial [Tepidisphaeraceae bacterium]|nr:glycosyltransferase family 2 protein [Tepidisphaeraceae bacterium]
MNTSVIIPCHNSAGFIAGALNSAAAQNPLPREVLVIDDASTDNLAEVLSKLQFAFPVRLLRGEFRNAAAARNLGIENATGDWVAMLDADDLWLEHHLSSAAELLEGSSDVAYMSNFYLDDSVNPRSIATSSDFETESGLPASEYLKRMRKGLHFGHSSVIYRRDRLLEVKAFDVSQKRRHDFDLWLRMIAGRTWSYDASPQIVYRVNVPSSISRNVAERNYYYLRALLNNR